MTLTDLLSWWSTLSPSFLPPPPLFLLFFRCTSHARRKEENSSGEEKEKDVKNRKQPNRQQENLGFLYRYLRYLNEILHLNLYTSLPAPFSTTTNKQKRSVNNKHLAEAV